MKTKIRGALGKCPKRVLQKHVRNPLILQAEHRAHVLTEKAYFAGHLAL
jgi:hypothetical protein